MSTDSSSSGSIQSSRSGFLASPSGSARPARPAQLDPAILDHLGGGLDPEVISEMSHASAAALLDRVHHTEDPQIVRRVITLVDTEGVDIIAQLWSNAEPDSLPGILWRLYLLRTWMQRNREQIARLWRLGEPVATTASAIVGVDETPDAEDIARTADSFCQVRSPVISLWRWTGRARSPMSSPMGCVFKRTGSPRRRRMQRHTAGRKEHKRHREHRTTRRPAPHGSCTPRRIC